MTIHDQQQPLAELVATRVMGWQLEPHGRYGAYYRDGDTVRHATMWRPDIDYNDVAKIFDRMEQLGFRLEIKHLQSGAGGAWQWTVWFYLHGTDIPRAQWVSAAATSPDDFARAVCLAALKALGADI